MSRLLDDPAGQQPTSNGRVRSRFPTPIVYWSSHPGRMWRVPPHHGGRGEYRSRGYYALWQM